MVDTIKFSQMPNAGNINNNDIMPSLRSGVNVILTNPWTFLPPGSTAQRPTPSSTINYRLRFNTDEQLYEYYDAVLGAWTQLQESAFTQGPFITYTASASLPDAQNLGALADGLLKQTISAGIATLNIALNGTDYYGPGFVIPPVSGGTGINNASRTINLGSPTTGYVLTSDASGNATWQAVSISGAITTINGDSGSVTPTAGVVTINGGSTGLTTTGSGSTLSLGGLLNSSFGGLGVSNPTAHGILIGEGASPVTPIVLSSGQILIGSTGADPVAAAINSGTGILVGNGAGSITVSLAPIATLNILSNITGGSAAPIANTLTATIDAAIGGTQGNILYRNASAWVTLAPGTSGQFLTSGGAAANVSWSSQVAPTGQALTEVNDTNVTLTLGGSPTTALLNATSLTLGWTGTLSGTRGGTGINNGSNTATFAGNLNFAAAFSTSGAFAVTQTYTGITNVTFPTSGTLATTSQIPSGAALTKTDDTNVTLTLGGSPTTALVNAASMTLGWTGQLSVPRGGTGLAALTAHNLLIGNGTSALTLLAPSATAGIPLISQGSSADPAYGTAVVAGGGTGLTSATAYAVICGGTTSTGALQSIASVGSSGQVLTSNGAGALPTFQNVSGTGTVNSGLINQVAWYAASGTTISGLSTANNGVLVTSSGGVPSILAGPGSTGLYLKSNAAAAPSWSANAPITQVTKQVFTSSGTYTPTSGMVYCIIECQGAGGAGGGAVSNGGQSAGAAGGGAGGYSRKYATAANIGASQTVTIGAAGAIGAAGNNPGGNGGDTSVGTLCIGKGGAGAAGAPSTAGSQGGAGGVAGTGDFTATGASGDNGAGFGALTTNATGANGASSMFGGAGLGITGVNPYAGSNATGYGAGGAGGLSWNGSGAITGSAGSAGVVIITEFLSV